MPNIKAKKRHVRVSAEKRLVNRARKSAMKTELKKITGLIEAGEKSASVQELTNLYKMVDSLVNKNLIHRNKAARIKSRITKRANAIAG
ncbi:MAG: 30S ribosomal protein S20 [Candidatus Wallbacteria bacterium HGW-Wallbacteria-1]|jgi:small subunit ribosomal protein S20|uniref:Small ribosomal subunit protein bS20 n=1 Tax=Candidatus Wallbacteria bacterium HGW-Wallbacteria-1 TaxID=2013854 RepID=A0A2N1PQ52_9BACT|nr:MAG: 30S ribosomal protein S20 [Candidatus Wallbacteria bacterium HGW-Wallbacteria-1]